MSFRIKAVVDKFVVALEADIQDRIMKEREMQSYIEQREREVAEWEAAWKAELSRREILSGHFLRTYGKDVINIHHGLLPSFKGGHPSRQAFEAGVKLIGATSHFVTEELDSGPIIEQMD